MTVSIVIPTYNHYNLLHQCLFDIYQKCSLVDEVLVVNDCSPDEEVNTGLEWWKKTGMVPVRHLRLSENVMFLRASNIGMQRAKGDVIILLSNDVRLHGNIVTPILDTLASNERTLIGGRYLDWGTGWNQFGTTIFPYLEGWLLATTKEGWKELGYFDERYAPSDFEDVDLSTTARLNNYHLWSLPETITTHLGGQSIGFNPKREAITIANKEKFKKKWM